MKLITLSLIGFLFYSATCLAVADTPGVTQFKHILHLIAANNARELSKWVSYPVKRQNPLPDIKNASEFIAYYSTLFDNTFHHLLKQYNSSDVVEHHDAYGLVGGPFTGDIWLDEDGKIVAINYSSAKEQQLKKQLIEKIKQQMHPSVNNWDENVLVAKSNNLLLRVDRTDKGKGLRYVCWSKGHTMKDKPDIVLYDGVEEAQGTQGGWTWTFKSGDWTYVVDDVEICGDTGKDCGLLLELSYKGNTKSYIKLTEIK